jgi:hypothetical protein
VGSSKWWFCANVDVANVRRKLQEIASRCELTALNRSVVRVTLLNLLEVLFGIADVNLKDCD